MRKTEIIKGLIEELKSLSSEKPQGFYYVIDSYADSYDKASIGNLIHEWNGQGYEDFNTVLPTTAKLYFELKAANNGIEQPVNYYVNLVSLAKNALEEVKKFAQS